MQKQWSDLSWEQLEAWSERDKKTYRKICSLIKSIDRNGYSCIGKSEPLKNDSSGLWSVRIDDKDRLIFRIANDLIVIASCMGHYE